MKTLSGTLKVVIPLGIGALAVFAFRAESPAQAPTYAAKKFELKILKEAKFKNGDETAFNKALQKFGDSQVDLTVTRDSGKADHYPPRPKVTIKTDKVTASEIAQRARAGDLTPIGSNVVTKLTSDTSLDLIDVLNALE